MSGTINLILITLLLVVAQQSQLLQGYEAYAWGMMLWLGVANAALLSNYDSAWFRVQEVLKLLVLCALAAKLSVATALVTIPLALMGTCWQWFEREARGGERHLVGKFLQCCDVGSDIADVVVGHWFSNRPHHR